MKTLLINNYDSFTYNIYQIIAEVNGQEPDVINNDAILCSDFIEQQYDNIILSPGPGHPNNKRDFGIGNQILQACQLPILGICLGHQGICCAFGGQVIPAPIPMHGQISLVHHNDDVLFANIPKAFHVVRYHSFVADKNLPSALLATAWTSEGLIMAMRHNSRPIWGVQFHPESICTEYGYQLFQNFKNETLRLSTSSHSSKSRTNTANCSAEQFSFELLVETIDGDLDTSLLFEKYNANKDIAIWLDSNLPENEMSAISIMGCLDGPHCYQVKYSVASRKVEQIKNGKTATFDESIFDFLDRELTHFKIKSQNLPIAFQCGFVGYFGYELKQETLGVINRHVSAYPDAQFIFLDRAIVYDHQTKKCYLLALADDNTQSNAKEWLTKSKEWVANCPQMSKEEYFYLKRNSDNYWLEKNKEQYIDAIKKCLTYLHAGESYEICLTNRLFIEESIPAFIYYLILRSLNPAPYSAFLKMQDFSVACSSMERFLYIDEFNRVETKPIKGTMPRGKNKEDDKNIISFLKNDSKSKSENLMIVDLLRNDLGMICEVGSVRVPKLMAVETYSSVHHLVSTITGQLKQNNSALDCIKACFPGGSMTGAPKIRTTEIIDQLENSPRGIYSGSIGFLSLNGCVNLNIVIRSAIIQPHKMTIGIGGAVINLSHPEAEYEEILLKAKSLLSALKYLPPSL